MSQAGLSWSEKQSVVCLHTEHVRSPVMFDVELRRAQYKEKGWCLELSWDGASWLQIERFAGVGGRRSGLGRQGSTANVVSRARACICRISRALFEMFWRLVLAQQLLPNLGLGDALLPRDDSVMATINFDPQPYTLATTVRLHILASLRNPTSLCSHNTILLLHSIPSSVL